MVSAIHRSKANAQREERQSRTYSITERLEKLTQEHPKLVRALEREDPTELYK